MPKICVNMATPSWIVIIKAMDLRIPVFLSSAFIAERNGKKRSINPIIV